MPKEIGWAIANDSHGLYVGWWQTRAEAICGHIIGYHGGNAAGSQGLTAEHRKEWARRKRRGDRVVKVTLSYT